MIKGLGSFTGIRIGVATSKAFSDSLNIPSIGISSLEALAYNIKDDGIICSIIDAKNNNCYCALYKKEGNKYTELSSPTAIPLDELINNLQTYNSKITFVGDGVEPFKDKITTSFSNAIFSEKNNIDSFNLGLAGISKYEEGENAELLPLYLRKPQAQRQLEEKLCKNN